MNKSKNLYLVGHPVSHSKSPAMHNALYEALGLDWHYDLMDCACEKDALQFMQKEDFCGLNITTPYKHLPVEIAKQIDAYAWLANGANVCVRDAKNASGFCAYNVDGLGCVKYLAACGVDFSGARVVICGSGPTSLSIMQAALDAGAPSVAILGRSAKKMDVVLHEWREKLELLTRENEVNCEDENLYTKSHAVFGCEKIRCKNYCGEKVRDEKIGAEKIHGERNVAEKTQGDKNNAERTRSESQIIFGTYADNAQAIKEATLIINATPLGMKKDDPAPFDVSLLSSSTFVFDAVYGHRQTALARGARETKCEYQDGRGMLISQAVLSAEIFLRSQNVELNDNKLDFNKAYEIMKKAAQF